MGRRTLLLLLATVLSVAVVAPVAATPLFDDVPDTNIFSDHIEWLALEGITQGCNPPTNNEFCPKDKVSRGQMAAFLVRALDLTDDGGGDHFTDDDNSVFEANIDKLFTAGITSGCNPPTNDQFCPNDHVTREQMAAFLRRALDVAPVQVTGLIATLSGGSGEIDVSWDANPEGDIDRYNVWHSELPGATKLLVLNPLEGPATRPGDHWYIIDWPRLQMSGRDCYQVSAVDVAGQEGPRSVEECFDSEPGAPAQVTGVTVGTGGGSGEAYVSWTPNSEGDMNFYNVYYSEFPGGPFTFETTVDEAVRDGSSRVFYIDFPVDLTVGKTCYVIGAVDLNEKEGPLSTEACFTP
ncbi:MAG: S-layer homology domain-containing protein [Acidimicrobiia bacterium]|nr:S-layer homology domain-containing protein [Acidimicrobiia bacterium]